MLNLPSRLSVTLHEDEYEIDVDLVRLLLAEQAPQWSGLPIERLDTSGTVNAAFLLGDDKVVRLPRTSDYGQGPQREAQLLPRFAPMVPLEVPDHLLLGVPADQYPGHWSVLSWIHGTTAGPSTLNDLNATASRLGDFVVALRRIPTIGAPRGGSYRARALANVDEGFRDWVSRLPDGIDRPAVLETWESCLSAGHWEGSPTWLHGDLRGDNLIARNGDLVGVIDWEACGVGDPCADYLAAWWLFDADSRDTFRSVTDVPSSDWLRAKGWALHMAVAAIPYYTHTNAAFTAQARRALTEILADG